MVEVNSKSLNQTGGGSALLVPSEVTQKIIDLHTEVFVDTSFLKFICSCSLYLFSIIFILMKRCMVNKNDFFQTVITVVLSK